MAGVGTIVTAGILLILLALLFFFFLLIRRTIMGFSEGVERGKR